MNISKMKNLKGVTSVDTGSIGDSPTAKIHLNNLYTVSVLVHPESGSLMERNYEVAVLSPRGDLIELAGEEDTIVMLTELGLYAFIEEISTKQMAHIVNDDLARVVSQLKEAPSDVEASFSGSMKYTRLFSGRKNTLIKGAMQYRLEFETVQDLKGLIFSELFFKVSGRSEDLLKFIYALDTWLDD